METLRATYVATRPGRDPDALAAAIALEQSLECPEELLSPAIREQFAGRVVDVIPEKPEAPAPRYRMEIEYPATAAGRGLSSLIQLLYGNVSFYPRIRLVSVRLPDRLLPGMPAVREGLPGIRRKLRVDGRPLLGCVLKPRGTDTEILARRAGAFAAGGGDFVKDDQNFCHEDFDAFRRRVSACAEAIAHGARQAGKPCLYFPFAGGTGPQIRERLAFIAGLGLPGAVLCGLINGLEHAAELAADSGLMWMCHPAGAGAFTEPADHGIAAPVLLGTLVRLAGADICNFPASGGRVAPREAADEAIIRELTRPVSGRAASLPCLAGGITVAGIGDRAARFGPDCMLLTGGDLMAAGDGLERVTREAVAGLKQNADPPQSS